MADDILPRLRRLVKKHGQIEIPAYLLKVHPNTLRNWLEGKTRPTRLAQEQIRKVAK